MNHAHPAIGIDVDDLRLPIKDALRAAARMGFVPVEFATVQGELSPAELGESGRKHLRRFIEGMGLSTAALVADIPGTRLTDPATVEQRVDQTGGILRLAREMGVRRVTASVGALAHPETGAPSPLAMEALTRMAEMAEACGTVYCIRPSVDSTTHLVDLLEKLGCPSLRVCLDPAAMVMTGQNPVKAVQRLAERIALAHARDGTVGGASRAGQETQLGEGEVDLIGFWEALEEAGYGGPHIIRRTDSLRPIEDISDAREYLLARLPR